MQAFEADLLGKRQIDGAVPSGGGLGLEVMQLGQPCVNPGL